MFLRIKYHIYQKWGHQLMNCGMSWILNSLNSRRISIIEIYTNRAKILKILCFIMTISNWFLKRFTMQLRKISILQTIASSLTRKAMLIMTFFTLIRLKWWTDINSISSSLVKSLKTLTGLLSKSVLHLHRKLMQRCNRMVSLHLMINFLNLILCLPSHQMEAC